ncbi:MAG: DUF6597 domain-containing transcriptional factor [Chryseolinea sp.]
MYHRIFEPPERLKGLVKNFFVIESLSGDLIPKEYQSMADGYPEIIIEYNGGFDEYKNKRVYLRAQHSNPKRLHLGNSLGLFGIRFYPHAIQQLFNTDADEIVNRVINLNQIIRQD